MGQVAVFHRIGEPTPDKFTHSIEQILAFDGEITFDGVYDSVFDCRLELKSRRPVLFVSGNQIGRDGFCNKEQLQELEYLGFILAWHGWCHQQLTELSPEQILAELRRPKWLQTSLYAYPHGEFDEKSIATIRQYGYTKAYSTTQGEAGNEFAIPRIYV